MRALCARCNDWIRSKLKLLFRARPLLKRELVKETPSSLVSAVLCCALLCFVSSLVGRIWHSTWCCVWSLGLFLPPLPQTQVPFPTLREFRECSAKVHFLCAATGKDPGPGY